MTTRRRRIDEEVEEKIKEKAVRESWNAARIERWLSKQAIDDDKIPTLRTIQRIVKDLEPRDKSGDWALGDSDSDDAWVVLYALQATIQSTRGSVPWFSQELADWIVRVSRAGPGLGPLTTYAMARLYLLASDDKPTRDLDAFLAFKPWTGADELARYKTAITSGWIPKPLGAVLTAMADDNMPLPAGFSDLPDSNSSEANNG